MRKALAQLVLILSVSTAASVNAQTPPYVGTWVPDPARSQLAGMTITISKAATGHMHSESQGIGYDFDIDGKDYPLPDGTTASWRAIDANTWEIVTKMNGKPLWSNRFT